MNSNEKQDEAVDEGSEEGTFGELGIEDKKLLRLRPRMKKHVKNRVPEEKKDTEYFEKRKKNTLAAKRCRERMRQTDQKRVKVINQLKAEINMRSGVNTRLEQVQQQNVQVNEEKDRYKQIFDRYFECH